MLGARAELGPPPLASLPAFRRPRDARQGRYDRAGVQKSGHGLPREHLGTGQSFLVDQESSVMEFGSKWEMHVAVHVIFTKNGIV